MSQSPLARQTRKSLPAFAHPPSRLSKSTSSHQLSQEVSSPSPSPTQSTPTSSASNYLNVSTPTPTPSRDTPTRHRNVGSSTSTTPKILYSPYATSTPPQGLSRSSSIPFDMAASAKAARRYEEERRLSTPVVDTGAKKKRFVRKKPIWQRTASLPSTMYDKLIFNTPTSIVDVFPDEHLANPISLGINAVHYLLVAPLFSVKDEPGSVLRSGREPSGVSRRWDDWENLGKVASTSLVGGWTKFTILVLLLIIAIGNAAYLFTRFRTYDMQLRSGQEPIASPHASPIPAPKVKNLFKDEDDDIFDKPVRSVQGHSHQVGAAKYLTMTGKGLLFLVQFAFHALLSAFGKPQKNAPKLSGAFGQPEDKIQSLRVWDPPEFCLAFFCAFPPTSPLLTHLLVPLHPLLTPLLHFSTTFLLTQLAQSYAQLVKDRMLLSAEVMREYDQRFVYKRVFANRVDRGVGTNEAEMVW
ncbi:hypothetical protein I316_02288 [Kwoniella heveanensis BCC8398]|uniref:Uncharacterized protein n=1 Tax=Kwoniella heveanensis BCC8398 TaxID=1296120 RepID=A0A1B9GXV7_9TREE|nr:hypothetical protein I316_02288 [Kwoniella heveanensis BCC8398]